MRILLIFLIALLPSLLYSEGMPSVVFNSDVLFKVQDENAFKYNAGLKVIAPDFSACAAFGINSLSFSEASSLSAGKFLELQKKTYGIKAHFRSSVLSSDLEVLAGTLCYSGSVSRLKNPGLSSGQNALSFLVFPSSGFNPSLPSFSSSEKPLSFSALYKSGNAFIPELQVYLNQNGEFVFSSVSNLPFCGISFSFTGGIFKHGFTKENSSWKLDRPFYREDYFLSFESRLSLSLEKLRMCLINGFSEQPSGKINGWTRLYTSVYAGPLVLDAAAFYCPDLTVCADGSLLEPALQFMLNPKVSFDTPCGTLSGGMIFFTDFVSSEKNAAAEPEVLNLKTAVRFQKKNLLLSLYAAYKNNFFAGEEIKSAKFSLSRSFKKIKPSLSVSVKEEKKRKIFSASVSALFKSLPLNQLSLNLENEREETKLSASLLFTGGSRSLRWNAKFSAEIK